MEREREIWPLAQVEREMERDREKEREQEEDERNKNTEIHHEVEASLNKKTF